MTNGEGREAVSATGESAAPVAACVFVRASVSGSACLSGACEPGAFVSGGANVFGECLSGKCISGAGISGAGISGAGISGAGVSGACNSGACSSGPACGSGGANVFGSAGRRLPALTLLLTLLSFLFACGAPVRVVDGGVSPDEDAGAPLDAGGPADAGSPDAGVDAGLRPPDPWADRVVRVMPGVGAGFGQDRFPDIVLGPPQGGGDQSGSLDVLSLGRDGVIELEFTDLVAVDGPGVDLLVFENPFGTFFETGVVAVSDDGVDWREFPCAGDDVDGGFPGCAGTHVVFGNPAMGISATDPSVAGGDGYDLSTVGLARARFVRVRDSGKNRFYAPPGGGFDLDAVAVVNGRLVDGGAP